MKYPAPPSSSENLPSTLADELPEIIHRAGANAIFAAQEFFSGMIRNPHTRRAYMKAVKEFLEWAGKHGEGELAQIAPWHVGQYFDEMAAAGTSIATRNMRLSALRHFFDNLVTRHAIALNPARTVRGEKLNVMEGRTPEIPIKEVRKLLASIDTSHIVGLRDRAILAVMVYTASRRSAVAKLRRGDFYHAGQQWMLHFAEKGGKSREIPVRHDLEQIVSGYIDAAGLRDAPKDTPLFKRAMKKQRRLSGTAMNGDDIYRMMKRRLKDFDLPLLYSPHSFRVTTITDLLEQNVPREDVQHLAGHADARTTGLYDRRKKKISRNIVERISV
ncbi:MAG TPA: tyrosine-type recombinase/integrase [Bryobacteraceae bacterium]|nr:tyrosine-type recombinase/integrase [Bryobacteraceae bacterium]